MKIFIIVFFMSEILLGAWVTELFGFWMTLLIYFVPTVFGLPLVIFENQMNWAVFRTQMASGRAPDQPLFKLMAGFFGSLLLLVPSLICRLIAVLLLFPPTRLLIVFFGKNWFAKKIMDGSFSLGRPIDQNFGRNVEREARVIDIDAIKIASPKTGDSSKDSSLKS